MARRLFPWGTKLATGETPEQELENLYYEGRMDSEIATLLGAMVGQRLTESAARQKRQAMGLSKGQDGVPLMRASDAPH